MKHVLFWTVLLLSLSCSRRATDVDNSGWFQIEIKNQRNIDCGLPEIIFLTNQMEAYAIIGNDLGTYIAQGLPKVNYSIGTKLWVKIRKPQGDELIACTTLGPGWAHVFISETQ
jgi:hypothetical protein